MSVVPTGSKLCTSGWLGPEVNAEETAGKTNWQISVQSMTFAVNLITRLLYNIVDMFSYLCL
jgi:hypothetical protein